MHLWTDKEEIEIQTQKARERERERGPVSILRCKKKERDGN
jgi:hypothetical protein